MKLAENLASVRIDGVKYALKSGETRIENLKFDLQLENKAENLYSWVVYLENDSDERSPGIQALMGMDMRLPAAGKVRLNTLRGDDCSMRSFFPESYDLTEGVTVSREPTGARSSDTTAFPYFDVVDSAGEGIVCGIGWSGQWKLEVTRVGEDVQLTAGFKDCDFILEPHEKVRSVRILICFGNGGEDKLRHRFVRLHRRFYSPVPEFDDNTFFPSAAQCFDRYFWGNMPENGKLSYFESEDAQSNIIKNAAKCKYVNAFWVDACWFDGAFRTGVGNYAYSTGFPNGLRGLSDMAHRNGMRFILWFEPIRAHAGTEVFEKFREDRTKIIPDSAGQNFLVNIGDPEVWQYQYEHIAGIIEENGVDMYRQDFNTNPYDYLKTVETPGRIGIAQIRFVEGIYRLWDELRERFPGLLIDNCASGGRLIDVETSMRAIPLWQSDMACRPAPAAMQNEVLLLSRYLPYHQGSSFDHSPYFMRSGATTAIACEFAFLSGIIDPEKERRSLNEVGKGPEASNIRHLGDFNPEDIAKAMKDVCDLREYWNGDFTALTPPVEDLRSYAAYTLRLSEEDRGIILVFRREEAPESFTVKLPEINMDREYTIVFSDEYLEETETVATGRQLSEGITVKIKEAPGSLLIKYRPRLGN